MFSGVYGRIDRVLNGTDDRALKKISGSGHRRSRIKATRDRGGDGGSPKN
jgi:hypothetical protein